MSPTRTTEHLVELARELLNSPNEAPWVEFKQSNCDPQMIGEYISALSNSAAIEDRERAYVLWGVRDNDHALVGTSFTPMSTKYGNEDLQNWLLRGLDPQTHFRFFEFFVDDHRLVLLEIDRASFQPVSFRTVDYVRVGSHKKKLRDHPDHARRLWKAFDQSAFEDGIALDDVGSDEVTALLDYPAYFDLMEMPLPANLPSILDALEADDLIKKSTAGRWHITNLGGILFAKRVDKFPSLRRRALRVISYNGTSRISSSKERLGSLGYANGFKGAVDYIKYLLPANEVIHQALRKTVSMYPDVAVRELIANALIHQDFALSGTGPMVEIFDDRIEVTNPGTPLMDPNRFVDMPPRSRNEKLAGLMRRARICEERGSGWDRIAFEIEYHQLPAPLVDVTEEHTRITLFSHRDLKDMDRADRVRAVYLHSALRHVNHQRVTNTSIRERFGIELRNTAKASRMIKEAVEDGLITVRDPAAPPKVRDYVPWWAASARSTQS